MRHDSLRIALTTLAPRHLATVVVIGAGDGLDVRALLKHAVPNRLIAVEGHHARAATLRSRLAGEAVVDVVAAVVAPQAGQQSWVDFNLARLSGLEPHGLRLRAMYPALLETGRTTVDAIEFGPWLESLGLDAPEPADNMLMLDVGGQEGPLLASLAARHLDGFPWILVRGAGEYLFDAGADPPAHARLRQFGYQVMAADRDTEPPWPLVLYHADPRTRKLARSERQVTAMSASLSARTTALAAAQAQAEEQTQRGNALANELERATVELTSVRQALSQAQVEQARSTTSCTEALHQARQTVERLERELAQAEVTVSRVERFRQLREADLQDLQQRHAALLDERRSLHLLLAGLADRLGAARDLVGKARGQGDGNDLTEPGAAKELRP